MSYGEGHAEVINSLRCQMERGMSYGEGHEAAEVRVL